MKKIISVLFAFAFMLNVYASGNLAENADFSNGLENWEKYIYDEDAGAQIYVQGDSVIFLSSTDNHLSLTQNIKVTPDKDYRFSAKIRTDGVKENGVGAALGFYYKAAYSEQVFGDSEKEVEMYFTSESDTVPVMLTLGGYSSENSGVAIFSDISVEEADEVPDGAEYYEYTAEEDKEKHFDYGWIVLCVLLAAAAAAGVFSVFYEKDKQGI